MTIQSVEKLAVFFVCVVFCSVSQAQRNDWRPKDFEPLTELPWRGNDANLEEVIDRIFRETNTAIRHSLLMEYFRMLPSEDRGRAFDLALALEGTNTPDDLVGWLLCAWAELDPAAAWERTKSLFELVGLEEGWLSYAAWDKARIEVQNRDSIRRSRYWLRRHSLVGFAVGCNGSAIPTDQRTGLLKSFLELWFQRFTTWPEAAPPTGQQRLAEARRLPEEILRAFDPVTSDQNPAPIAGCSREARIGSEIIWRRWIVAKPDRIDKVIKSIDQTTFPPVTWPESLGESPATISTELLLVWRKVNPQSLMTWAESERRTAHQDAVVTAKCILINEVEAKLRQKWLGGLLGGKDGIKNLKKLAAWEPQLAMESAIMVDKDQLKLCDLVDGCAHGPWEGQPWNASHSGLGYLMDHGLEHLPVSLRPELQRGWFTSTFMEQWGSIDVGEAARFGLRTMLADYSVPRQQLIDICEGRASGDIDDGLVDRTICALRVWAVIRPEDMKKWIETIDGSDMQKALRWTVENPWGSTDRNSKQ